MRSCRSILPQACNSGADSVCVRQQDHSQPLIETASPSALSEDDGTLPHSRALPGEKILDCMPAAIVAVDRYGYVCYFNNKAQEYIGAITLGEEWRKIIERSFKESSSGDEVLTTRGFLLSLETGPMPEKKGQIIIFHDVSRTAEMKRARERFSRLAELGQLSARMAHQIRTPLAASMLFLSNIKDSLDASSRQYNNLIKGIEGLKTIESMIADMLLFSSDKCGSGEKLYVSNLIYALENEIELLRQQYGCDISINCDEALTEINGNLYALKSIISNILENSAQACMARMESVSGKDNKYHGNITVQIFLCEKQGFTVGIKIADNGAGIAMENMKKIMEPFYTTKQTGTGLGLAVVKSVVDAHGGEIEVHSVPGSGTQTQIFLP